MVAQSITGGVQSLMRKVYNAGGGAEKENNVEIHPAKRRRIDEDVKRDEGDQNELSATKPQNGNAVQRRISSRTRRNRNRADHDGNEGEEGSERGIYDNEGRGKVLTTGPKKSEVVEPRYSRRSRQRNNADHDGNENENALENLNGTLRSSRKHSLAGPKVSKRTTRQSSGSRNDGVNIDPDGTDEVEMDENMAENVKLDGEHSANSKSGKGTLKRPSLRARPKRNNADHIMNEGDFSETSDADGNTESNVHSITGREKDGRRRSNTDIRDETAYADYVRNGSEEHNKQLDEEHSTKRLSDRSRRKRSQADHQGNVVEDLSLINVQNGDACSPTTPTKRLKSRHNDAGDLTDAEREIHTSPDKLGIIPRSRTSLPKSKSLENYRVGANGFHDQPDADEVQLSPSRNERRNHHSLRKSTPLNVPKSSHTYSMNNEQDSPFISEKVVGSKVRKLEIFSDAKSVGALRRTLRDRLTCNRSTKLVGIESEYLKVYRLIEQTVTAGEGNSVLLIGARGCGKSAIVCKALEEVSREHSQAFYTIRLNGFFLTDDRLALREIWRQLGQEMEVEDETSGKSYADTLSKLLALLSHSTETDNEDSAATQKSLIFIMEEFDQFTSHPRQTLLYNLFDVAQSRKTPIAVIGMTTRIDIAESMEKRVKSRFSHRYIHIPLARSFDSFREICRANLECTSENLSPKELMQFSKNKKSIGKAKKGERGTPADFLQKWNNQVSKLIEEPSVHRYLRQKYNTSKSAPDAINALTVSLFDSRDFSDSKKGQSKLDLLNHFDSPESKLIFLPHLPTLALSLLISAARLDIVLDTDTVNFSMVYEEYSDLAGKARIESAAGGAITAGASTKVWSREVAIREWDRLVSYGFLLPLQGTVAPFGMYRIDVALEEIAPSVPNLDRILEKWCKQI